MTGAASGIGRGNAARLAAEGARVSLWDRDEASLSEASSEMGGAHPIVLDIADFDQVNHAAEETA